MSASYPTSVKSFTTKASGAAVQASHVNDLQDEVTALEQDLVNGMARVRLGSSTVTIASDAVTVTKSLHAVDTESAAATDTLSTITAGTGVAAGHLLTLYAANVARVVTVSDSVGNILLAGGNYVLDSAKKSILLRYDGTNWVEIARAGAAFTPIGCVGGRLTLTSAVAVTTADVTAATSVYFTPCAGSTGGSGQIALYDGTTWNLRMFTELTIALGSLTSGLPYDVFVYDNAGVVTIDTLVAWTNGTTRATALALQNGVLSKTGALTRRYLGTFYTTSTTTTEDSVAKRFLWNCYNRVPSIQRAIETTDSWAYTTATWRQANGAPANKVELVIGVVEDPIDAQVLGFSVNATTNVDRAVSIGYDSTTGPTAGNIGMNGSSSSTGNVIANARLLHYPAVGYHYYAWLEYSEASGTTTWKGDNGSTIMQAGIQGVGRR